MSRQAQRWQRQLMRRPPDRLDTMSAPHAATRFRRARDRWHLRATMPGRRRMRLIAVIAAVLAAGMLLPAVALGDGDPASDVLLAQSVFYPYTPAVSSGLQAKLNAETAAAGRVHFPIKVALIASPFDLGAIPGLFGKPQQYADFLEVELSFSGKPPLLVVMRNGYGVQGLDPAAAAAASSLPKPSGASSDDLAQAAILAVPRLAAAAGHPIDTEQPIGGASAPSTTGGSSRLLSLALLAAAVASAAAAIIVARRGRVGIPPDRAGPERTVSGSRLRRRRARGPGRVPR